MIYECVINVSEGRDVELLSEIRAAGGDFVRDVHSDVDHNRSVLTIVSGDLTDVYDSAHSVVRATLEAGTISGHDGVHPRHGIIDVVPFVSFEHPHLTPTRETIDAALSFGSEISHSYDIPVFCYDYASKDKVTLPAIRKNAFASILPAYGPSIPNKKYGAICVGAREPLIAINVNLDSTDIALAKSIAKDIRESSGGINGVRSIGLELPSQNKVQVSMNIVNTTTPTTETACTKIIERATKLNIEWEIELVGLLPKYHFAMLGDNFIRLSGLSSESVIDPA